MKNLFLAFSLFSMVSTSFAGPALDKLNGKFGIGGTKMNSIEFMTTNDEHRKTFIMKIRVPDIASTNVSCDVYVDYNNYIGRNVGIVAQTVFDQYPTTLSIAVSQNGRFITDDKREEDVSEIVIGTIKASKALQNQTFDKDSTGEDKASRLLKAFGGDLEHGKKIINQAAELCRRMLK